MIQKKLNELEIMYQNPIYICISWYSKNLMISSAKVMSAELKKCVTGFMIDIFFGSSLGKVVLRRVSSL